MLTIPDTKEQLSYAYVHAVAAHCGFSCKGEPVDRDSVDVTLAARGRLEEDSILYSPKIDLQLKATSVAVMQSDGFDFDLPMKNYNDLRQMRTALPKLLVILFLPGIQSDWLIHSEECLIAKQCAYWHNLKGAPEVSNDRTRRIRISRSNVFSPDVLRQMMVQVSREEEIGNAL